MKRSHSAHRPIITYIEAVSPPVLIESYETCSGVPQTVFLFAISIIIMARTNDKLFHVWFPSFLSVFVTVKTPSPPEYQKGRSALWYTLTVLAGDVNDNDRYRPSASLEVNQLYDRRPTRVQTRRSWSSTAVKGTTTAQPRRKFISGSIEREIKARPSVYDFLKLMWLDCTKWNRVQKRNQMAPVYGRRCWRVLLGDSAKTS